MDRRTKLTIVTLMVAAFTIGTIFTGALLLVPPIEDEYGIDITTSQWVLNVYAIAFAMCLVAGGRLADMFGRRRLMLIGLLVFLLSTVGCALAPSIGFLIGARAVQGIGSAAIWPCVLAIGATVVTAERRGLVIGLILGAVTAGNVIGPLFSGVAVALGDWRLFFLLAAVLSILTGLMVTRVVTKEAPSDQDERVDYVGMLMLSVAIVALLYALDVGADLGWGSAPVLGLLALCVVLLAEFPFVERRVADPMMPPSLLANREFMLTLSTNGLLIPSVFIAFLYFPQYMHKTLGWSVLEASFGMLPLMILLSVGSVAGGGLYNRFGPKRILLAGYTLTTLGAVSVVFLVPSWGYYAILPAMILIGFGGAFSVGAAGTAAVSAVDQSHVGLAGGLSFVFHLGLGAIGVAGATAIMFGASLAKLRDGLADANITMSAADQATLNGSAENASAAQSILMNYSSAQADTIRTVLTDAFTTGMSQAYWLALASAIVGIGVVLAIDEKKLRADEA
ncbi:MAG: MFS transporter [Pseudomonadota bacterium]